MKAKWILGASAICAWSLLGACGSSDDDKDGDGGEEGGGSTDIDLGDGDSQGGANSTFALKPGPITQEQLDALHDSACAGWVYEPELQPSVLQLVVDVSGSMDLPPEGAGDGAETKWVTTREALRDTVASLPGTISLGAVYYPNMGTQRNCANQDSPCIPDTPVSPDQCVNLDTTVDVAGLGPEGSDHRIAFLSELDAAIPAGGTPTHDAFNIALEELSKSDAIGERFILLITDGQPTFLEGCSGSGLRTEPVDEQPIIDAIAAAAQNGVRTFVIGSPGSEENADTGDDARPWLSRAAIEGGTATADCDVNGPNFCHFDMSEETDFSAGLRTALAAITGQITSCELSLPEPPEGKSLDLDAVNVVLTPFDQAPEVVGRTSDEECEDGWSYGDSSSVIDLCPNTCLKLRENSRSGIELFFGCESVDVGVK